MFTKLLVPLDGSDLAEAALGRAAEIARASSASVELLLVHQPCLMTGEDAAVAERGIAREDGYLRALAAEISSGAGVPVTHVVVPGNPVEVICKRASECGVDLIIMTTHGRGGWSRAWMGSVADAVSRHAAVPVLMIRAIQTDTDRRRAKHSFHKILAPLDGLTTALEIAGPLASLAHCSNASVCLLQIVQPVRLVTPDMTLPYTFLPVMIDQPTTDALAQGAERDLSTAAEILKREGIATVEKHVVISPSVSTAIADFARANAVDAVAMTTHGRGLSRLLIGSVADKVRRAVDVPVLLEHPVRVRARAVPLNEEAIHEHLPALAGMGG